jgi:hypothetical protein
MAGGAPRPGGLLRLTDLDAEFVGDVKEKSMRRQDSIVGAQGIMFQCPLCAVGKEAGEEEINGKRRRFFRGAHYGLCFFRNPQGTSPIPAELYPEIARWEMTGTSLEDLTLQPSILFSPPGCGWHGFITNGNIA